MKVVSRAQLLADAADPLAAYQTGEDDICLLGEGFWATVSAERPGLGGALVFAQKPVDADAVLAELTRLSKAKGLELCWLSAEGDFEITQEPWTRGDQWVWMWAQRVVAEGSFDFVELDDDADAQEILDFAMPLNPLFEGMPGQGINEFWVGARDGDRLIGCGTARRTPAGYGYLAGILVDPAYRGRGLGSAIIAELSRRFLETDPVVTLSAYSKNKSAISVYRRLGFNLAHEFSSWLTRPFVS